MNAREIATAARSVAAEAEARMAWNYDSLQLAAYGAVTTAFEEFARLIEAPVEDDQ